MEWRATLFPGENETGFHRLADQSQRVEKAQIAALFPCQPVIEINFGWRKPKKLVSQEGDRDVQVRGGRRLRIVRTFYRSDHSAGCKGLAEQPFVEDNMRVLDDQAVCFPVRLRCDNHRIADQITERPSRGAVGKEGNTETLHASLDPARRGVHTEREVHAFVRAASVGRFAGLARIAPPDQGALELHPGPEQPLPNTTFAQSLNALGKGPSNLPGAVCFEGISIHGLSADG